MTQRRPRRYNLFVEVKIEGIEGNDLRAHGVAVNFNYRGVGVCCLSPLQMGAEVLLTFYFIDEKDSVLTETARGTIRWTKNFGHLQTGGVEFSKPLHEESHFLTLSHIELVKEFEDPQ